MSLVDVFLSFVSRNISSVFIFVVLFFLGYLVLLTRPRYSNLPPGPRRLPIIGNLLDMRKRDPRELFKELREIYGDIFSLQIFNKVFIVINGYESLKQVFVGEGDKTSDRFINPILKFAAGHDATGVVFSSGQRWKHNRRFCLHHLRNFGMGKDLIQTKIHEEARFLLGEVDSYDGAPFDIKQLIHSTSSNVIASIIFGHRFEYDDEDFQDFLRRTDENTAGSNGNFLFMILALRHVPGDPFKVQRYIDNRLQITKFIRNEIQTQKETHKDRVIDNLLHAYLDAWKHGEETDDDSEYSNEELETIIHQLFIAGTETTASTMRWFLIYIMRNPDVQTRIQAEIDEHVPKDRLPSMADKPKLVNTQAAILETLRLSSVAPFSIPHRPSEYFEFKGYAMPRDAFLVPNLHSVHFDETHFPNANTFDPSRFIDRELKIISMDELLPFSIGRRICFGESLAKSELFLFLAAMLQRFQILPPEGSPPPPAEGTLGVLHGPCSFRMRAIKRL